MTDWMPIEEYDEAQHGAEVIGCHVRMWDDIGMRPTMYGPWTVSFRDGKWRSSWDGCEVVEYMCDFGTEYKEPECQPTHFMPLPSLPKER